VLGLHGFDEGDETIPDGRSMHCKRWAAPEGTAPSLLRWDQSGVGAEQFQGGLHQSNQSRSWQVALIRILRKVVCNYVSSHYGNSDRAWLIRFGM
jgi:hypothetical protein